MSKKITVRISIILISIAIILPVVLTWNSKGMITAKNNKYRSLSKYTIFAELNQENKTLSVKQRINYINNEGVELTELYLHVYSNAFMTKETAPFLFNDFTKAYRNGFQSGYTEINMVSLHNKKNTRKVDYELQGEGSTILKISLPRALKDKEDIQLDMEYVVHFPSALERFGYVGNSFNFGNWYPIMAVYDDSGWNIDKYYSIGDPFYSDVANYDIQLITHSSFTVAGSGKLIEKEVLENNKIKWIYKANNMRDFAMVASDKFKIIKDSVDNTTIKVYYYPEDEKRGKEALKIAKETMKIYNAVFGQYPYPTYSVVQTQFPSGMEYPGLVYIGRELYKESSRFDTFLLTIVHETAHQWWYGAVGNDQIDEAWLDESFATFSESIYVEKKYGEKIAHNYISHMKEQVKNATTERTFDGKILKSLKDFKSWGDYGPAVYDAGALVLCELRSKLGDKIFFEVLQKYYKDYCFKIATSEDFIDECEKISGKNLNIEFQKWLGIEYQSAQKNLRFINYKIKYI